MKPYENLSLNDMEGEVWKDIPGYKGKYQASNLGRVKSLDRHIIKNGRRRRINSRIMKQFKNKLGYLHTDLCTNGIRFHFKTHRLVLASFKKRKKMDVDHINHVVDDNRLINLRYTTHRTNSLHRKKKRKNKYPGIKRVKNYDKWEANIQISGKTTYIGIYNSPEEAREAYLLAFNNLTKKEVNTSGASVRI